MLVISCRENVSHTAAKNDIKPKNEAGDKFPPYGKNGAHASDGRDVTRVYFPQQDTASLLRLLRNYNPFISAITAAGSAALNIAEPATITLAPASVSKGRFSGVIPPST